MNLAAHYNYATYSFALEQSELANWLEVGPHAGQAAPDFELPDLDGARVRLSELRGRPVVLEFGSYTCPIFSDRVAAMERLALEHPQASFLVIAVREAHPGEITPLHASLSEKRQAARRMALEEGIHRRVLIDDLEGTVHRAYGGAWNPVYVLDAEQRIGLRRAWNHPGEVAQALSALAIGQRPTPGESVDMPQLPGRGPVGLRLLERGGRQALRDFYRTVPPPLQKRLRESPSRAVRSVIEQEEQPCS